MDPHINSPLNANQFALLRGLQSALNLKVGTGKLTSDQVASTGHSLGLNDSQIFTLVSELKNDGFADVIWGGSLAITAKGQSALNSAQSLSNPTYIINSTVVGGSITNSTVVGGSTFTNAAVGAGAQFRANDSALSQLQVQLITIVADLAAANRRIQDASAELPLEVRPHLQDLAATSDLLGKELQKPKPEKGVLDKALDRAKNIISMLGGMPKAVQAVAPVLTAVGHGVEWLSANLGSLPTWPFTSL
jgi:hypothetical protein